MKFRLSVFALALAGSVLGFMAPKIDGGPFVKDGETLRQAVDYAVEKGYVPWNLHDAVINGNAATNAAISADDVKGSVAKLHAAKVYPKQLTHQISHTYLSENHPEYFTAWMTAVSNDFPVICGFALYSSDRNWGKFIDYAADREVLGLALGELNRDADWIGWLMERYMHKVKAVCTRQAKIILRRKGRSFVTRDGVNPLEPYAKRLETILNAPRMHGMADFCREMGLPTSYAIPEDTFLTDDEIRDVCDKVMVDDIRLKDISDKLRYSMGTDAYNAFVKEYNEGTTK